MKCYYHVENAALGICPACYRGVCKDCIAVQENGISCNNATCEKRAADIFTIINANANMINTSSNPAKVVKSSRILNMIIGFLFVMMGILFFPTNIAFAILFIMMGLTFFIYGLLPFIRRKKDTV